MGLVGKAAFECDLDDWELCSGQQGFSMLHASLHKPRIRGDAHRVGECTDEVAERQTTLASNIENRNAAAEIALHDLGCEPDLPGRECWSGVRSDMRSEEHTSELTSLMRISYAVFSL